MNNNGTAMWMQRNIKAVQAGCQTQEQQCNADPKCIKSGAVCVCVCVCVSRGGRPLGFGRQLPPKRTVGRRPLGGGFGVMPWCDDLVCSWRRLLADRHSLPFPWTLFLHRRWCPSASHHPVTFLFLPALTVPLPCLFLSLGLSLHRPRCPSASHHSFPSHSLGRLCQRSPRTCPVSLTELCSPPEKLEGGAKASRPAGPTHPVLK